MACIYHKKFCTPARFWNSYQIAKKHCKTHHTSFITCIATMSSSKELMKKVIVACWCCHLAYDGVRFVNGRVTSTGLKKHINSYQAWTESYNQDPNKKFCNNFFNFKFSILKKCLSCSEETKDETTNGSPITTFQLWHLVTGTSNGPGSQPVLHYHQKFQKLITS